MTGEFQLTKQRCTAAATETKSCPINPRPAKTQTVVMQIKPAGLDVVGELISSITTRVARTTFRTNAIASTPATDEQAK
jgi:hypothetical protein